MQEVIDLVDELTDPKKMSKEQYKEFLEELIGDLQVRLDAVREELGK